jgi:hypothetical protein
VLTWRLDADETPWLLVYTDACKNTRFGGLGVVIFDRTTGRRYVSSAICPKDIEESFARRGYIINQLELLAILTALLTFPELFRNRRALWFVEYETGRQRALVLTHSTHSPMHRPAAARWNRAPTSRTEASWQFPVTAQ